MLPTIFGHITSWISVIIIVLVIILVLAIERGIRKKLKEEE